MSDIEFSIQVLLFTEQASVLFISALKNVSVHKKFNIRTLIYRKPNTGRYFRKVSIKSEV